MVSYLLQAYGQEDESSAFSETVIMRIQTSEGPIDLPSQTNGIDCGVFVCWWAYCFLTGRQMTPISDMSSVREWILGAFLLYLDSEIGTDSIWLGLEGGPNMTVG